MLHANIPGLATLDLGEPSFADAQPEEFKQSPRVDKPYFDHWVCNRRDVPTEFCSTVHQYLHVSRLFTFGGPVPRELKRLYSLDAIWHPSFQQVFNARHVR